ncbi:hypothetical protein [Rhodococcoides yunnanense]|uniref:Uncharacterized protein n=1 Tax=Rhodococcoides yunnanense TaxID=278209 RepID=A0ABU4BKB5_9NOCA|nr:hypothetical protein [Rhodococcus yunnanensis]MDV6264657.1 hypothetical protein [Rhodococcus yunnanensis]
MSLPTSARGRGFVGYIEDVCAAQAAGSRFACGVTMTFDGAETLEARSAEAYKGFLRSIARPRYRLFTYQFTSADLIVLLMANAGVITALGRRRRRRLATTPRSHAPGFAAPGSTAATLHAQRRALYSALARTRGAPAEST